MPAMTRIAALFLTSSVLVASSAFAQDPTKDPQKQIDQIKSVLPKFAIPMREVGDRFQNMYFAAKGGNWALAAYMSKYMNGAMNPATITKPNEYPTWKTFYDQAGDYVMWSGVGITVLAALIMLLRRRQFLANTTGAPGARTAEYDADTGDPVRS